MSYTIKPPKYQEKIDSFKPSQLTESIITNNKSSYLIEMNNHHQRTYNLDGSSLRKNQSETKENFKFEINISLFFIVQSCKPKYSLGS